MTSPAPRIELVRVCRDFGPQRAVKDLDLKLEPGRIHAIVGENGAGKSTALKMMAGMLAASAGEVRIAGKPLAPATPHEAITRGVGLVHQHFMLIEAFTALENVVLGCEPAGGAGVLDMKLGRRLALEKAQAAGLTVDLDARVDTLGVGEKQRLEILRVLYRGARALLLDEPTAVLSPIEVGELYRTLRKLADGGATIAVVTHRLDEVARFADEVTAMRRGELVHHEQVPSSARGAPAAFVARLARAVMGGDPPPITQRAPVPGDAPVALELREIHVGTGGGKGVRGVDLEVAAGEIVGIAGVEGNGQNELVRALGGLDPLERGSIMLAGEPLFAPAPEPQVVRVRRAKRRGLVVIYDDRHRDELVLGATVADNLVLGDLGADESATMRRRLKRFAIEPADPTLFAAALSGGNQQKLVMARALDRKMSALVVAQPTRGVDVGTARIIHEAIAEAARAGAAVLVVSADLNELRALAHRIVVMLKGAITAELAPSASDEAIGRAMLGVDGEVAA